MAYKYCVNVLYFVLMSACHIACKSDCDFKSLSYDPTLLESKNGKIQGKCHELIINDPDLPKRKISIISWLGVPFAEPPINELRFKDPMAVKSWSHIRDGTIHSHRCYENDTSISSIYFSEDCLYLNIFVPAHIFKDNNTKTRLAINFYIHGGRYIINSGVDYINRSPALSYLSNTIVVTSNYRLGVFGFFFHPEIGVTGNQGFKDQQMALKWIYENAERFRGDSKRITIYGNSAGAFFTNYHLIHRNSWPYFTNAILQSGCILYSSLNYITRENAIKRTAEVFAMLGCGSNSSKIRNPRELRNCVEKLDPTELIGASNTYYNKYFINNNLVSSEMNNIFSLVQDGQFINETIKEAFENGNHKKTNILIGFTSQDGGWSIRITKYFGENPPDYIFLNRSSFEYFLSKFYIYLPSYPTPAPKTIVTDIINEYKQEIKQPANSMNYFQLLIKIITDFVFKCPSLDLARIYSKTNRVFVYSFNYLKKDRTLPKIFGVVHTNDFPYVFAEPFLNESSVINSTLKLKIENLTYTDYENRLSKRIIKYFSNFIKYNSPNGNHEDYKKDQYHNDIDDIDNPYWIDYKTDLTENNHNLERNYLRNFIVLNADRIELSNDYSNYHCEFWKNYNTFP